ncbi:hypothetical protein F4861DRAFT_544790 [Xylaria intraflava]|nr:hypothetical protein F4861DRAFT_544790 [Xylaria intraflava]
MHGRKVNIAEHQHRWMHERGACGCEVIFPALQQPRLIQRSSATTGENGTVPVTEAGIAGAGASGSYSNLPQQAFPSSATANYGTDQQSTQQIPQNQPESALPLFREDHVGENVEVAVRLSSLYGAEWTKDHAQLHQDGRCACPVSFEKYRPINTEDTEDENETVKQDQLNSSDPARKEPTPKSSAAFVPLHESSSRATNSNIATPSYGTQHHRGYQIPVGKFARWTMDRPQGSLLDDILGPVGPDASAPARPLDVQTIHYQREGLPIAGNPIVCGPFGESEFTSIVEFQQPETTIAGFPIGAGPEGDSHAGDFTHCHLRQPGSGYTPGTRPLSSEF